MKALPIRTTLMGVRLVIFTSEIVSTKAYKFEKEDWKETCLQTPRNGD